MMREICVMDPERKPEVLAFSADVYSRVKMAHPTWMSDDVPSYPSFERIDYRDSGYVTRDGLPVFTRGGEPPVYATDTLFRPTKRYGVTVMISEVAAAVRIHRTVEEMAADSALPRIECESGHYVQMSSVRVCRNQLRDAKGMMAFDVTARCLEPAKWLRA